MRTKLLLACLCSLFVVSVLADGIAEAAKWNEKIYNKSPSGAYDLTFILRGRKKVAVICSPTDWQPKVSHTTYQGQRCTQVTWAANPPSSYIRPGSFAHFGIFDKGCCAERIKTAYWTDLNGNRIPGSVVWKPSKKKRFIEIGQNEKEVIVRFINEIHDPEVPLRDIMLTNIRYRIFDEEVPLEALNEENVELNSSLLLAEPGPLVIPPDGTVDVVLPEHAEPGQWVVIRFDNFAPEIEGSSATEVVDWMEFVVEQAPPGYYVAADVYNFGPDATGLTVAVEPAIRVIDHTDEGFAQFIAEDTGTGQTQLKWSGRSAPPAALPTSDSAHVVWTADRPHKIVDAWWTDAAGQRFPGTNSVIYNATTEGFYREGQYRVKLTNATQPTDPGIPPRPMQLTDIMYAIEKKEGILVQHLNNENRELMAALTMLEPGPVTIAPGDSIELVIPGPVETDDWVNLVATSTVTGSTISRVINYSQMQARLRADFNYDGIVNFKDFAVVANEWLQPAAGVCTDMDGDGYGDPASPLCTYPELDCDDYNPSVHPGASEVCDGLDNDCDGVIDEGANALCDDGDICNGVEVCGGAAGCQPGTPLFCDDGLICTDDYCDSEMGCIFVPNSIACDDGLPCTVNDQCIGGACIGQPIDCSAFGDQCNDGICDEATGTCVAQPKPNGIACDDGNPSTVNDMCINGVCAGEPAPICGNCIVEADEECDDCNTDDGDGCSSTCQIEYDSGTPVVNNRDWQYVALFANRWLASGR